MHIPTADTDTLELLPFREALERSGQRGDYDAARWLYVPDFYTEYRYILGTRGEKPLICIGVNPLDRRAGRPRPDAPERAAHRALKRVRQLHHVQCIRPARHAPERHGRRAQ